MVIPIHSMGYLHTTQVLWKMLLGEGLAYHRILYHVSQAMVCTSHLNFTHYVRHGQLIFASLPHARHTHTHTHTRTHARTHTHTHTHIAKQKQSLYGSHAKHSYCCPTNQHWDVCAPLRHLSLVQANPPRAG